MEKSAIRAVRESIDVDRVAVKLRDEALARAKRHTSYSFELVRGLPDNTSEAQEEHGKGGGLQYRPLYDKGIPTLLKLRIPLIEFHGGEPDEPYRLRVHVETTLLRTHDGSSIRHNTWVYQGGSLRVTEWNQDGAKLLVDGINQGILLLARRVTETLFE